MLGCDLAYANVLGKVNRIPPFSIRLRNHYPSKNEARVVDVSLLGTGQEVLGGGVGRSRKGVGHEVLSLVQGVGRAIFSYP